MSGTNSKTKPFDPAEYLDTPEALAAYLTDALETGDPAVVADALGVIAGARGMSEIAREAGVFPTDGDPEFATVMRVAQALGLRLSVTPNKAA